MKLTASGRRTSRSNGSSTKKFARPRLDFDTPRVRFAVCIQSGGYVDLLPRQIYRVKPDKDARKEGLLRVIDGSGEDYLYPIDYFAPVLITAKAMRLF